MERTTLTLRASSPADLIQKNVLESMQAQVENFVLNKIQTGEWGEGSKIPSERELSDRLDVSRTTVRNAVQALTTQGYFDRRIGQGTFVITQPSPPTKPQGHGTFGYVICKERELRKPLSAESFYFDVFTAIEEETVRSGRHVLFTYLDDHNPKELDSFEAFLDKVDGLVLEEVRNPMVIQLLVQRGIPAVLMAPTVLDTRLDLVTMDVRTGAVEAVGHLLQLGHSAIGIINGPLNLESSQARFEGWQESLKASGISPEPGWIAGDRGWSAEAGSEAMETLLDTAPELTAVFCANDLLAIGALATLARRGISVPTDMSVIGFDDSELSRHTSPPLTTMRIHARAMARAGIRKIMERLDDPELPPVITTFPIRLVSRGSTSHPRPKKQGGVL